MLPTDLKAEQFAGYPPKARALVTANLISLQQLPLSFLASLLREVIDYDFKFPAERTAIDGELACLGDLSAAQVKDWFQGFSQLSLDAKLENLDWINQPGQFVEQQAAYLWSTHQLDAFRRAATEYGNRLRSAVAPEPLPVRRLGVAVVGQGVASYDGSLFRKLREHGTYFNRVKPDDGFEQLLAAVAARAEAHPVSFGHWYVDGGQPAKHSPLLTCVSYQELQPLRSALLKNMDAEIGRPGMGPEELRSHLARLSPSDLGMNGSGDPVLDRFQVKVFTEGSGTQIFSTTFAQWTAREALRRAQPLTLLVRFSPRQRQRPMNELLSSTAGNAEPDYLGSLVDADMASYYHWMNQQRLSYAEQSAFVAWFEGHNQAIAIGPSLPRGTTSESPLDLGKLLSLAVG
jgi:hypothetical protein